MAYIYFDKNTRKIISISNSLNDSLDYVEKPTADIKEFIDGIKNINDYKLDKNFNFVNCNQQTVDVNNSITKINYDNTADLIITCKGKWHFRLQKKDVNFNTNCLLAVTSKNNINRLVRTISIPMSELRLGYTVDFKYSKENDLEKNDLWVFNCPLSCGIADD